MSRTTRVPAGSMSDAGVTTRAHAAARASAPTPAPARGTIARAVSRLVLGVGHAESRDAHAPGAHAFERFEPREHLTVNTITPINDFLVFQGSAPTVIRVDDRFNDPDVNGTVTRFDTVLGEIFLELFDTRTPITAQNFLRYIDQSIYANTVIHRSVPNFIIQGGGFRSPDLAEVQTFPPIQNEPGISNLRGTIAMAKLGGDPNSATSQWFFNLTNNASNLDNQNGGFTVFGEVLGDGMQVVDAIAAVPTENLGGAFDDIPLINYQGGEVQPENLVLIRSIARSTELDFSVTSSNAALVAGAIITENGQQQLRLSYGPGTGQSTVTLTVRDREGTAITASFTVRVVDQALASPTTGPVNATPGFVPNPGPTTLITLTAPDARDNDGTVSLVEYFRDNGDGVFDPATDTLVGQSADASTQFRITTPTSSGPAQVRFFARARDNDFLFGQASQTTVTQNRPPAIGSFTLSRSSVTRPAEVILDARNVTDDGGSIQRVEFWRDINGNGQLDADSDLLLVNAPFRFGGYRITLGTNILPAGAIPFLAVAYDQQGVTGTATATLTVNNTRPVFDQVFAERTVIPNRGETVRLRAVRARDTDGRITRVEYFLDTNNNGVVDVGTDSRLGTGQNAANEFEIRANTTGFGFGNNRILAVAIDDDAGRSDARAITIRINRPPVITAANLGRPTVETNGVVAATVTGISDDTGQVRRVEFFWDRDVNNRLDTSLFDRYLGPGLKVGNVWNIQFNASILYDQFDNVIFAQAIDADGARGAAFALTVRIVRPGTPPTAPALNPYDPEAFRTSDGTLVSQLPTSRGTSGSLRAVSPGSLPGFGEEFIPSPLPARAGTLDAGEGSTAPSSLIGLSVADLVARGIIRDPAQPSAQTSSSTAQPVRGTRAGVFRAAPVSARSVSAATSPTLHATAARYDAITGVRADEPGALERAAIERAAWRQMPWMR